MNEALLTMGMPVYNEDKYIGQAIEYLLAQTFKDFILIISDNASTDKTQQICEYYAKKDKRIIYIRHKENKGSLFNYRYVLEQAKTPYFVWSFGHDKWHPCFVEKLLPALIERKVVLSYSESGYIGRDGAPGKILRDDYTTINIDKQVARYLYILRNYKMPNIFQGIWLTEALKNCDLNIKSPLADIIIVEQAAFEGKFKQHKEVLFWMRIVRGEESYNETVRRQLAAARGKPAKSISMFSIKMAHMIYVAESIKIIFRKRYSLGMFTKMWLIMNIIYFKIFYRYTMFTSRVILKKLLVNRIFSKLNDFWHKGLYKN